MLQRSEAFTLLINNKIIYKLFAISESKII